MPGDYDYASSPANQHLHAWVDGRNAIAGSLPAGCLPRSAVGRCARLRLHQPQRQRRPYPPSPTPTATATATATATPTSTPTPTPGITLTARGYKVQGRHTVDLSWSGASSSTVDIYRNGALLTNTGNDGFYTDSPGSRGHATYTYRVCNAGTQTCSNNATVTF